MSAVIEQPRIAPATQVQVTPSQLLQLAMDKGVDLDRLEKLYELQRQWEAHEARKSFTRAMARFKENPPQIVKDKHVEFQTARGTTEYHHATLGAVCDAIVKGLSAVGVSHDWDPDTTDPKRIAVTCILTHESGHEKRVTMHGPPDDSGGKNAIQAMGSTVTYLQRYTLFAATGIAAMEDDDGTAAGKRPEAEPPKAPEGYATWKADMTAKADEGKAAHLAAWKSSKNEYRAHATTHDREWWEASKKQAAKAGE